MLKDPKMEVELDENQKRRCKEKTCRKLIYFAKHPITRAWIPISQQEDGTWISHFKDCTRPNDF